MLRFARRPSLWLTAAALLFLLPAGAVAQEKRAALQLRVARAAEGEIRAMGLFSATRGKPMFEGGSRPVARLVYKRRDGIAEREVPEFTREKARGGRGFTLVQSGSHGVTAGGHVVTINLVTFLGPRELSRFSRYQGMSPNTEGKESIDHARVLVASGGAFKKYPHRTEVVPFVTVKTSGPARYSGLEAGKTVIRQTGRRKVTSGWYYGRGLHEVADIDGEILMDGAVFLKDEGGAITMVAHVRVNMRAYDPGAPLMTEKDFDRLMEILARAMKRESGSREPDPEPEPETRPEPEAAPEAPDRTRAENAERLAAMDAVFDGVEDELQGRLLTVSVLTRKILEIKAQIDRLMLAIDQEENEPRLQKILERLRLLRSELRMRVEGRDELTRQALDLLKGKITELRKMRGEWGFVGDEYEADLRVLAAEERMEYLRGQFHLARGESKEALVFARKLQRNPATLSNGYLLEGLVWMERAAEDPSKLGHALNAFREARKRGLTGFDFDQLEAEAEIAVLKAIQAKAGAERKHMLAEFEQWIESRGVPPEDLDRAEAEWFFERLAKDPWQYFMKMGWGSTIGGTMSRFGFDEAAARSDEAGEVATRLAGIHVSLNILIRLRREGVKIADLRKMTGARFAELIRRIWGHRVSDEQASELRRRVMSNALQLDDVKKMEKDEFLVDGEILSKDLVAHIPPGGVFQWALDEYYVRSGVEVAGGVINGWTIFLTFAPAAKIARAGSLTPMASGTGAAYFKEAPTLGRFFAASRPVQAAMRAIGKVPGGKALLESMDAVARFQQESLPGALGVGLAGALVEYKVGMAAEEYVGKKGRYLVEVIGAFTLSPEVWAEAFDAARITSKRAARLAGAVRRHAALTAREAKELRGIAQRARQLLVDAGEGAVDPATLRTIQQQLRAVSDDVPEVVNRLQTALRTAEAGASRTALRQMAAADDAVEGATDAAARATRAADKLDEIADLLPPVAPRTGHVEVPAGDAPPGNRRIEPEVPRAARAAEGGAPRTRGDGVLNPHMQDDLLGQGDALLGRGRPRDAAATYERALAELGDDHALAGMLRKRIKDAQEMEQELARRAAMSAANATPPAKATGGLDTPFTPEFERKMAAAAKNGPLKEGVKVEVIAGVPVQRRVPQVHREPIGKGITGSTYVVDEAGNKIAVMKRANSSNGHAEWLAEEISSRFDEAAGFLSPRTRKMVLTNANGVDEVFIVQELVPAASELGELGLTRGQLMAYREDLAEDLVRSLLHGDADRHFGNYLRGADGKLRPIDRGLGDPLPTHADYRRYDDLLDTRSQLPAARDKVRQLQDSRPMGGDPAAFTAWEKELDKAEAVLARLEKQDEVWGLYHHPDAPDARTITTAADMEKHVDKTMERHFDYIMRQWGEEGAFVASSMGYQDLKRALDKLDALEDKIPDLVQASLKNPHPDFAGMADEYGEFTTKLYQTRIKKLREFLRKRMPEFADPLGMLALPGRRANLRLAA